MSDERIPPKKLIEYLRERKSLWFITAALVIGIFLMLFGRSGGRVLSDSSRSEIETRLENLCEQVGGVSEVTVMVRVGEDGGVKGVAIVCSGGDDPTIKLKLTQLLCALFGIGSDSVSVIGGR